MAKPIIFGISGTKLTNNEIELFKKNQCTGFILFARNIESKNQLLSLTSSLKSLYPEKDILIFVDQEGGRVARIKPPVSSKLYPAAEYFSKIYDHDKSKAKHELENNYYALMSELKDFGVNSPCAPVCDLLFPNTDNVIGDRSFGNTSEKVIDLCKSAINGISKAGGIAIIKHIPGHGRATVDSHFELPIVDTAIEELENTDFQVFRELSSEKIWAMTAHIIYSSIDPEKPATLSKKVINYIRNKIGFDQTLVSDDICMHALHGKIGKKLTILKQVINLAKKDLPWKEKYSNILKETFEINDIEQLKNSSMIEICNAELAKIKPFFTQSLVSITQQGLDSGCDIMLHCSGDIDEMRAICEVLN